jgi:hypothetical protein
MNESVDVTLKQMKDFSKKTFGIGIYVEDETTEKDFLKTVQSIVDCDYDHGRITVCINHSYKVMNQKVKSMMKKGMRMLEEASFLSVKVVVFGIDSRRDFECFKIIGHSHYVSKILPGELLPPKMFSGINTAINEDLKKAVAFRGGSTVALLMKAVNYRYLDHNDYDKMQDALEKEAIETELFVEIK